MTGRPVGRGLLLGHRIWRGEGRWSVAWCIVVPLFRCRGKKICEKGKGNEREENWVGFHGVIRYTVRKALEINTANTQQKNSRKVV